MSRSTEFDREEIILKAMNLFWKKGYEGTSLKDLTNETGLLKGTKFRIWPQRKTVGKVMLGNLLGNIAIQTDFLELNRISWFTA